MKRLFVLMITCCLFFVGCASLEGIDKISENLTLYTINAIVDEDSHTISAKESVEYKNNTGARLDNICLHLYPNAFRADATTTKAVSSSQMDKCYTEGFDEGNITINSVLYNNKTCGYEVCGADQNILRIDLPQALDTLSSGVIQIDFVTKIPHANHRLGYGEHAINCGNFYPIVCVFENGEWAMNGYCPNGDPFYSDIANYDVTIQYPLDYTIATTGNATINDNVSHSIARAVRDFAFVLSKEYDVLTGRVEGTTVNYYYYDDDNAQSHFDTCVKALSTFNSIIGCYPYDVLNVCKTNFLQGGMEYPNLVFISDEIDVDGDYHNTIVHEIAHQWFYGVVGNNECVYPWLDEALTEYVTALFYDKNTGYERTYDSVMGSALSAYLLYCDMYREVYGDMDTSMNRTIYDYKTESEYVYMTYVKGVLMFDSISEIVGKNKMQKCISRYYTDNAFGIATPKNLIESFERTSGKNLTSYISSWLDGTVVLEELSR